jgi:DNA-binding response OmpR family regulator
MAGSRRPGGTRLPHAPPESAGPTLSGRSRTCASDATRRTGPILIIEDEPDYLRFYERVLRRLQYEVVTAGRGADGVLIAGSKRFGLVVTDLELPDMDGIAVIRAIRARPDPPPIIVVSGFDSPEIRRAAADAGASGYLAKPFSVSALTILIKNVLGQVDGTH